jgi:thioesterase domain-containing protein
MLATAPRRPLVHAEWLAATCSSRGEAARHRPPDTPFRIVGYSNGAALAFIHGDGWRFAH